MTRRAFFQTAAQIYVDWLPCLLVVGLPLAVGGAHQETVMVVGGLALVHRATAEFTETKNVRPGLLYFSILTAAAVTFFQLLPLPVSWFAWLAPGSYPLFQIQFGVGAWASSALDLPAAGSTLVRLAILLWGCGVGSRLRRDPTAWDRMTVALGLSGIAVVSFGLVQAGVGLDRPYNAFGSKPQFFVTSFVNPNHSAAFTGLASFACASMGLRNHGGRRWLWIGAALFCSLGVLLSLSKGALAAYAAAGIVFLGWRIWRAPSSHRVRIGAAHVGLFGIVALVGAVFYEPWRLQIPVTETQTPIGKLQLWSAVPRMVRDHFWLGIGPGSFGPVSFRYLAQSATQTFTHLENEWLQPIVDWGVIPGTLILGLAIGAGITALRRQHEHEPSMALVAGVLFLALHNLVDFNLELLGIALPATMLLAGLSSGSGRRQPRRWTRTKAFRRAVEVLVVSMAAGVAIPATAFRLERDTARVRQALKSDSAEPEISWFVRRHPSDFLVPLLMAEQAFRVTPGNKRASMKALRWTNTSMLLAPYHPAPHRMAGRVLLSIGREDQAWLEYGLAAGADPQEAEEIAREVIRGTGRPFEALAVIRGNPEVALAVANVLVTLQRPRLALTALEQHPTIDPARLRLEIRALQGTGAFEEALEKARRLERLAPDDAESFRLLSSVWAGMGERSEAVAALERGARRVPSPVGLWQQKALLHLLSGDLGPARSAARAIERLARSETDKAPAYWLYGRIDEDEKETAAALQNFRRALALRPYHPPYILSVARAYIRLEAWSSARELITFAAAKYEGASWLQRLEEELRSAQKMPQPTEGLDPSARE